MKTLSNKESQDQLRMAKNMRNFLNDTKGIPCLVVNLNEGKKMKNEEKEEIDVPGEYQVESSKGPNEKKFTWKITFDTDDIDEKGKPRRHLILQGNINFEVCMNSQLIFILNFYQVPVKKKAKTVA